MATSRASHLIKGPRDHSDHASEATRRATPGCNRARKQQESWNGASTTAGASKEGTHWWIARHRLDNYEDRALMSPWPKPKNSTGQEGAKFETPAARQNARRMQRKREGKKRQAAGGKQKRGHEAKPAGGQHQPAKAPKLSQHKVDPPAPRGRSKTSKEQTVKTDERYSTHHSYTDRTTNDRRPR